jgi:hypothetical protein
METFLVMATTRVSQLVSTAGEVSNDGDSEEEHVALGINALRPSGQLCTRGEDS